MSIDWSKAPEGATHYVGGDVFVYPWHNKNTKSFYIDCYQIWVQYTNDQSFEEAIVGAIPRPTEQPQWNGEGNPPIGTEVEYLTLELKLEGFTEYLKGKILAYHDGHVWMLEYHDGLPCSFEIRDLEFRPIKSDRDQQIDALLSVIQTLPNLAFRDDFAEALYDKGVRVEI